MRIRTTALASILMLVILAGGTAVAHDHDRGRHSGQERGQGRGHGADRQDRSSVEPSPSPSSDREDEPAPSRGGDENASGGPASSASPTPSPDTSEPAPRGSDIYVDVQASSLLAQIGTPVRYSVVVENRSTETAEGISVTQVVADELDVVAVPVVGGVADHQILTSGTQQNIVWTLDPLPGMSSVVLEWTGRAVERGDLEAFNNVVVETPRGRAVEASQITFLAVAESLQERDKPTPRVLEKVITTRRVPVTQSVLGGLLPLTGPSSRLVLLAGIGLVMILAGITLMTRRRAIRLGIGICALALVTTACVSSTEDRPSAAPTSSPEATTADTEEEDEEPQEQVKGKRIFRDDTDQAGVDRQPENEDLIVQPDDVETSIASWREVTVVTFESKAPDTVRLNDVDADNSLSYVWEQAQGIVQATSSVMITRGAIATLFTSVTEEGDGLQASATLTNVTEDKRMEVSGHIVFSILRDGEVVGELTSQRIETTLNPNGETTATFEYLLPDGDYAATARFQAD